MSTTASAPLMVIEMRPSKANSHCAVPPITPTICGAPGGGVDLEVAVDDRAERVRRRDAGQAGRRGPGGRGHDHRVVGVRAIIASPPTVKPSARASSVSIASHPPPDPHLGAVRRQKGEGRGDEGGVQAGVGDRGAHRRGRRPPGSRARWPRRARPSPPPASVFSAASINGSISRSQSGPSQADHIAQALLALRRASTCSSGR